MGGPGERKVGGVGGSRASHAQASPMIAGQAQGAVADIHAV
jgi:hypothetical protein